MAAEVYSDEELESLRRFPEIGREELFRFFTLARRTWHSSTRAGVAAQQTGWALPLRCTHCRGWGSCPMTWPRHRGPRLRGWPTSFGLIPMKSVRTGDGRRPARIICGWWRSISGGGHRRRRGLGTHLPGAQRKHQLLRLHRRRHRGRTRPSSVPPGTSLYASPTPSSESPKPRSKRVRQRIDNRAAQWRMTSLPYLADSRPFLGGTSA